MLVLQEVLTSDSATIRKEYLLWSLEGEVGAKSAIDKEKCWEPSRY
jgi:hypothetical protein